MNNWLATLLLLLSLSATLADDDDHQRARQLVESGSILPLEQLMERVVKDRNWRLLEVELEQEGEQLIYEIELLDEQGRVRKLRFDAVSGEPVARGDDD